MVTVKFKEIGRGAGHSAPAYAKPGDSGADLRSLDSGYLWVGETRVFFVGLAIELPEGYEAQIRPRSSFSAKGVLCHLGTIDQGYRGELGVTLTNISEHPVYIEYKERIAQLVIVPCVRADFERVAELGDSVRGESGWGSSGRL